MHTYRKKNVMTRSQIGQLTIFTNVEMGDVLMGMGQRDRPTHVY
jgi:hypothetical protein